MNVDFEHELSDYQRERLHIYDFPVRGYWNKVACIIFVSISYRFIDQIWRDMQKAGLPMTVEEGLARVRNSTSAVTGYALIMDATDAKYLDMTNCDLQMVGSEFSRKPYGLAVPQGSFMKDRLNDA